jgi:hypothetical protein
MKAMFPIVQIHMKFIDFFKFSASCQSWHGQCLYMRTEQQFFLTSFSVNFLGGQRNSLHPSAGLHFFLSCALIRLLAASTTSEYSNVHIPGTLTSANAFRCRW